MGPGFLLEQIRGLLDLTEDRDRSCEALGKI